VNVRGKTILVTGAGRGIGRSLATHFAGKGANLALLDVNADDVNETRARCTQLGVTARSYLADAANEDSVVGALGRVMEDFGALDGLINNAGIVRDGMLIKVKDGQVVGKMSLAQWQAVIDTNLTGVFLCAREAAQHMISRNVRGVIVNVSSISRAGLSAGSVSPMKSPTRSASSSRTTSLPAAAWRSMRGCDSELQDAMQNKRFVPGRFVREILYNIIDSNQLVTDI